MTISVAVCTYNGELYIKEQIDSIIHQSIPVDEIIVCDDCSSDSTIAILKQCAECSDIPIHIHINPTNLGVSRNFERAMSLCSGDIIFFSDQDDIWNNDKVKEVCSYFDLHPNISVVFTNAHLIDEYGRLNESYDLWDCVGFDRKLRRCFDRHFEIETFFLNKATGATMALRNTKLPSFSSFCDNQLIYHDYCLCLWAIDHNGLGYIDKKLMKYRTHSGQKSGIKFPYQEPRIYYHQYRLINIVPDEFPFHNPSVIEHLEFYKKRKVYKVQDCIIHFLFYLKIYRLEALNFYVYDIISKIRK